MDDKVSNHDELVRLLLRRIGPLRKLKRDILVKTGRKCITRPTIKRAMETAIKYLLANEIYSQAMDDWQMEVTENVSVQEGHQERREELNPTGGEVQDTQTNQ